MQLDHSKLNGGVKKASKTVAQCPACASVGGDNTGNNLVIYANGKFSCAAYPGSKDHNSLIWKLAGGTERDGQRFHVSVNPVKHTTPGIIRVNGRFGRVLEYTQKNNIYVVGERGECTSQGTVAKVRPLRPTPEQAAGLASKPGCAPCTGKPRLPSLIDSLIASKGLSWSQSSKVEGESKHLSEEVQP